MYPEYVLNHSYEDTDVFVSIGKLKNHADCGVTLSLKNCFGIVPVSIYGDDAGVDEPNEKASRGRGAVCHVGTRQPAKIAPVDPTVRNCGPIFAHRLLRPTDDESGDRYIRAAAQNSQGYGA